MAKKQHDCDDTLERTYPNNDQAQPGERWKCTCGKTYIHICDEANGCYWQLVKAK